MRGPSHRPVVLDRREPDRLGTAEPGQRLDQVDRLGRGVDVRGDRPRPAVEQGRGRGERAGPLAAGHRVAADVVGEQVLVGMVGDLVSGRLFTLPTSVTTPPRSRASTTASAMWSGGTATTVSWAAPSGGCRRAGAQAAGGAHVLVVDVAEPDLEARALRGQAHRGAEQPGADDVDGADAAQSSGTARTLARSRRSAAAPCR